MYPALFPIIHNFLMIHICSAEDASDLLLQGGQVKKAEKNMSQNAHGFRGVIHRPGNG